MNYLITLKITEMSQILLYLKIEQYLAEWYKHELGGTEVLHLPRGSSESDILERFLASAPMDKRVGEVAPEDANLIIAIPSFRDKDPRYYNYLPPRARKALERNIYVRFRIEMWEELHKLEKAECMISDLIWAWMENHGISDDPKHWETIRQMYYRKRKAHKQKIVQE